MKQFFTCLSSTDIMILINYPYESTGQVHSFCVEFYLVYIYKSMVRFLSIYKSMLWPVLEYATEVRHPGPGVVVPFPP